MAFRPTIAVYINSEICDICYCRNWSEESLFIECAAIIAFYGNCRTRKAFLKRRHPDVKPSEFDRPGSPWSKKAIGMCADISEMFVCVDLSEKCIYTGNRENRLKYCQPGQKYSWEQFRAAFCPGRSQTDWYYGYIRKKYEELCSIRYADFAKHMKDILNYYVTDLSDSDLSRIRQLFYREPDLVNHVSGVTAAYIKKCQEAERFRS